MSDNIQGTPFWYELTTEAAQLDAACAFYGKVLGWKVVDAGVEGYNYRIARSDTGMVAGLCSAPEGTTAAPPSWLIYFAADDTDASVEAATKAGARVEDEAQDIPGTGRFAQLADPQGNSFGFLQPDMSGMTDEDQPASQPFDQQKAGHAHWHELMTSDPKAGFAFYAKLFGWTKGDAMDMGDMGKYQMFAHNGTDAGGMMGNDGTPVKGWLPYFGVSGSVSDSIETIKSAGGTLHHGPVEVPGGAFIAIFQDPLGGNCAIVGPER